MPGSCSLAAHIIMRETGQTVELERVGRDKKTEHGENVIDHQESHDSKSLISLMFSITHNLHYPLYYTHRQLIAMDEARACAGSR